MIKKDSSLRERLSAIKGTPFHPQWIVFRNESESLAFIGRQARGFVLDIGAGNRKIENHLPRNCNYVSLDYLQTVTELYGTRPHIFADGQQLPIKPDSADTVLLLDVLEHISRPDSCIAEIKRVLRPGGILVLQTPFLYPLHDVPYDYQRFTLHGLRSLADRHGFSVESEEASGSAPETAALLLNLALSGTALSLRERKSPLFYLAAPILACVIPAINILGVILSRLSNGVDFMPYGYRVVWTKPAQSSITETTVKQ